MGQKIRKAREERGLSQEQLAERIARDQRSVSEYESGKRRIYAHDLPTIAKALDMPILYFYQDALSETDLDSSLLQQFHQLNVKARKTLIDMAQLLIALTSKDG